MNITQFELQPSGYHESLSYNGIFSNQGKAFVCYTRTTVYSDFLWPVTGTDGALHLRQKQEKLPQNVFPKTQRRSYHNLRMCHHL